MTDFSTRKDQDAHTPKQRRSPLKIAVGLLGIYVLAVACLSFYAKSKDANGDTPLILAASKGQTAIARILIAAGSDLNAKDIKDRTALAFAARHGKMDCVKALIAAHADVNEKSCNGTTPLMMAALLDQVDCVKVLIAAGAEVNAKDNDGNTALKFANDCCEPAGDAAIVEALKAAGAKTSDSTPMTGQGTLSEIMKSAGA